MVSWYARNKVEPPSLEGVTDYFDNLMLQISSPNDNASVASVITSVNVPDPVSVKQESIQVEMVDPCKAANDKQAPPFSVSESSIESPPSDPSISLDVKDKVQDEIEDKSISPGTSNVLFTNIQENNKIMQESLKEI